MVTEILKVLGGGAGIASIIGALAVLFHRTASFANDAKHAATELSPNHGGSTKDKVNLTKERVDLIVEMLKNQEHSTHEVRALLSSRLDGHDREIKQLRDALDRIECDLENLTHRQS